MCQSHYWGGRAAQLWALASDGECMIIRPWRARPPAVRTVLLLVLAVPMLVVIAITANETLEAGDRADRSLSVVETAGTLEELVELRAALAAEQRWTAVVVKLNELGIDTSAAAVVLGLDPIDELRRVTSEVDAGVPMLDDPAFAARLAGLRQGTFELSVGLAASGAGYSMLASELAGSIDLHLASLADDSSAGLSGVQQAGTLADAAARWDLAQADQLWGWMGVAAGFVGGEEDPLGLLADANTREAVYAAEVERALPAEGAVRDLWFNDPSLDQVRAVQETYRDRVAATLNSGVVQPEGDLVALLSNMDEFLSVSGLAATSSTHSSAVVSAALDDVATTAHAERDAALASRNRLLVFATLVVTALGLIVVAVSRTVIRPLAQMAQVAAALQEGSLDERVEVAGPRETRVAALALNNAVDQLKLAEQQALALADERLDDPVFDASVPGLLGASLRRSVSHLHESLSDRDDYRRRLQHEAAHDSLTQLPNRKATLTYLEGALSRGERSGQPVAALFVDIDFFKDVNDRYGHAVGDQLLTVVARRLRGAARGGDLVGRIGGDEFLVVVEQVLDPEALTTMASRLLSLVSQPVELDELVIRPSATIGIAISSAQIPTAEGLVRAADLALYQAKEAGRGGFEICDEELRDVLAARAEVTEALGDAIDRDELVLHFQPVVDAQTRLITGAEALVRWERPGVGLVQPESVRADRGAR